MARLFGTFREVSPEKFGVKSRRESLVETWFTKNPDKTVDFGTDGKLFLPLLSKLGETYRDLSKPIIWQDFYRLDETFQNLSVLFDVWRYFVVSGGKILVLAVFHCARQFCTFSCVSCYVVNTY